MRPVTRSLPQSRKLRTKFHQRFASATRVPGQVQEIGLWKMSEKSADILAVVRRRRALLNEQARANEFLNVIEHLPNRPTRSRQRPLSGSDDALFGLFAVVQLGQCPQQSIHDHRASVSTLHDSTEVIGEK
jgi:hypothetical protein